MSSRGTSPGKSRAKRGPSQQEGASSPPVGAVMAPPVVNCDDPLFQTLSLREQQFILHPDVMVDPVAAAVAVGYAETTAKAKAHGMRRQLMHYLLPVTEKRMAALGVTPDRVRNELAAIAFANEADYMESVDIDGETIRVYRDPARLPEHLQRAIKSVTFSTEVLTGGDTIQRVSEIQLYSKMDALKELADILGLKDPRSRRPEVPAEEDQKLLENLEPEELEIVTKLYMRAAARTKQAASEKRDRRAIEGTASVVTD